MELAPARRPHKVVWTDARVEHGKRTQERDAVSVWTVDQLVVFLQRARRDRLHALFHLIALRGLRRGEAIGLRWRDVDLDARQIMITQSTTETGREIVTGPPRSAASRRTVALDRHTVAARRAHAERQRFERRAAGKNWSDTGYVFTRLDGRQLRPSTASYRFRRF